MAPIRRYLRITKYSVLEVRIYLEKPSDAPWLLSSRDPVLPRIIQEVRPKVLPKLREENANAQKKTGKKKHKAIKDVAEQEDFEATIFLTETSTRHSLLTKQKDFKDRPRIKSTGSNLTGWLRGSEKEPIRVDEEESAPAILREEGDETGRLEDIPEASRGKAGSKRKATDVYGQEDDALFVSSSDEEYFATQRARKPKTRKRRGDGEGQDPPAQEQDDDGDDEKKKLALNTSYDGFSIYGRILCLVVKRKSKKSAAPAAQGLALGGSQMMEQWVSTQAAQEEGYNEDDEG